MIFFLEETDMRCGNCGAEREYGDVCCESQAANQGRLHATCSHEPPPMSDHLRAIYDAAASTVLAECQQAN